MGKHKTSNKAGRFSQAKYKWISDCCIYWSQRIYEGDIGIDWSDALDGKGRCYRCGDCVNTPQKCHVVPKALGGRDDVSNIIPLCAYCHDEQPDVIDPTATWDWIKRTRPEFYGGLRVKRIYELFDHDKFDASTFSKNKYREKMLPEIHKKTNSHWMQNGAGGRVKDSTIAWAFQQCCELKKANDQTPRENE